MVGYSLDPENTIKSRKSRGSNLHVHFKNTSEAAQAINVCMFKKPPSIQRMSLYRSNVCRSVLTMVELVRCAPAKQWGWTQGWCPKE